MSPAADDKPVVSASRGLPRRDELLYVWTTPDRCTCSARTTTSPGPFASEGTASKRVHRIIEETVDS